MTTTRTYRDRRWTALILLTVAQFVVVVLDASIVNVAMHSPTQTQATTRLSARWRRSSDGGGATSTESQG